MDASLLSIAARSHRQAMDWSLVLASQGIEHTIVQSEHGTDWRLMVFWQDHPAAVTAIAQYQRENRGWPWPRQQLRPGLLFDWGSLAWAVLAGVFFWVQLHLHLDSIGSMLGSAVANGQWWRVFTAMWLHADLGHFATNAVFGFVLLGLALGHYGTGTGLLAAYLAGAGGNLATGFVGASEIPSLGASGMVMGALGLLAVQSFSTWQQKANRIKYALSGIAAGVMLFALLGLSPETDVMAHLGGFISGLILGGALKLLSIDGHKLRLNFFCGFVFALLVVIPWWFAIGPWFVHG